MSLKCLVQPGDGVMPLIKGIQSAKKSIEIVIFRFNRREIEKALEAAVTRGVHVHALIANTNRGGEKNLRDLELRLLEAGVTVARTAGDLVRYHGKLMIVDQRVLYLLSFNFTYLDMERSRSFAIITTNKKHVAEAVKLFTADTKRQRYIPDSTTFVVSPINARTQLAAFIKEAKKELLIYDPEVSDPGMIRLLEAKVKAGVTVNIIGKLAGKKGVLPPAKASPIRLHTRTIIRDGASAFVGSQSLRALELDARREVGLIFRDSKVVKRLLATFQDDWESKTKPADTDICPEEKEAQQVESVAQMAKKVAKAVAKELPPMTPVVESTVRELGANGPGIQVDPNEIENTVRDAVKDAVKQVIRDFVEEAVVQTDGQEVKA